MMLFHGGVSKSNDGKLYVIALAVGDAIPAGAVVVEGVARSSAGYLYVVIA